MMRRFPATTSYLPTESTLIHGPQPQVEAARIDRFFHVGYVTVMDYTQLITIEPNKRSGQPCIRGLRMTVRDVLEYLASGMSVENILADFPDLTADDIRACLTFAADRFGYT